MDSPPLRAWFRYLPVTPAARRWGFYVLDAGYTRIPPGASYPPAQHPDDHSFTWEKGRTLSSYTIVSITRGGGWFESAAAGPLRVGAGDAFIVFPGEWHRYRPDPATGWDEYWVEFDGPHARDIMAMPGFSMAKPVTGIGHDEAVLRLFLDLSETIQRAAPGFEPVAAAQTAQIVARILAARRKHMGDTGGDAALVRRACFRILEQLDREIDFAALAAELGLSHSGFRKKFRRVAGVPPGRYQQRIRLGRACQWLRESDRTVTEIADLLGYESVFYFSRLFKRRVGVSPSAYRKLAQTS